MWNKKPVLHLHILKATSKDLMDILAVIGRPISNDAIIIIEADIFKQGSALSVTVRNGTEYRH